MKQLHDDNGMLSLLITSQASEITALKTHVQTQASDTMALRALVATQTEAVADMSSRLEYYDSQLAYWYHDGRDNDEEPWYEDSDHGAECKWGNSWSSFAYTDEPNGTQTASHHHDGQTVPNDVNRVPGPVPC